MSNQDEMTRLPVVFAGLSMVIATICLMITLFRGCDGLPLPPGEEEDQPTDDPLKAIGKIAMRGGYCSGTIVRKDGDGRHIVVSAAHCFGQVGEQASFFLRGTDTPISITVTAINRRADIAICKVSDDRDLPWINIAEKTPAVGTPVFHAGFGVHVPGNTERGKVAAGPNRSGQVQYNLSVSSGDSGGGIAITKDKELLSPVCCTTCFSCPGNVYGGSPEEIRKMIDKPASYWDLKPVAMPDPPEEDQ